jgi:HlyD family secretion protein
MRTKMASAGDDPGARRKIFQELPAKIDAILKPDQKQKYAALRAQLQGGAGRGSSGGSGVVWVLRDKKPVAVTVRTGATDGTYTQVFGDLKPGDLVIVGGGPKPKVKAASTPFGPAGGGQQQQRRG